MHPREECPHPAIPDCREQWQMDILLLDQLRQAVTRIRRERDLDIIVLIDEALQNGNRHVRLREGLARTDKHAGNGIRLMSRSSSCLDTAAVLFRQRRRVGFLHR